jgi:pentatricopeptide repeat protein
LLHKALELEPGNLGVLFMLGVAYEKLKMYDRAISTWEAKMRAGGDKVTCYIFMIRCYCKKGDRNAALRIQRLLRDINEDQAERVSAMIAETTSGVIWLDAV